MGKNRETELLREASGQIPAMGRALYVLFVIATVIALMSLVFYPRVWGEIMQSSDAAGAEIISGTLGRLALLCPCLCCALLARDAANGESPFSGKQAKRVFFSACAIAIYTFSCFLWQPLISSIQERLGPTRAAQFSEYAMIPDISMLFWMIVVTLAMLLFAMVLNYGKTLQMLVDETG